jgi:hypothetical protein
MPDGRADATWMAYGQQERGGRDAPGTAVTWPSPIFCFVKPFSKFSNFKKCQLT